MAFLSSLSRILYRSPASLLNTEWSSLCLKTASFASTTSSKSLDNKVPVPPKKPGSSYLLYAGEKLAGIKSANPGITIPEMQKKIGNLWKALPAQEKQRYTDRFLQLRKDYEKLQDKWWIALTPTQQDAFTASQKEQAKQKAKKAFKNKLKELDYPTRRLTSVNFYIMTKKSERGNKPMPEFFSMLLKNWKVMSTADKQPYNDMSLKDTSRYEKAIKEWRTRMMKEGHEKILLQLDGIKKPTPPKKTAVTPRKPKLMSVEELKGVKPKVSRKSKKASEE